MEMLETHLRAAYILQIRGLELIVTYAVLLLPQCLLLDNRSLTEILLYNILFQHVTIEPRFCIDNQQRGTLHYG